MNGISLEIDYNALIFIVLCIFPFLYVLRWNEGFSPPAINYSFLGAFSSFQGDTLLFWGKITKKLPFYCLFLLLAAFCDPRLLIEKEGSLATREPPPPKEGIAIYLVLDQSGSMKDKVFAEMPNGTELISKIDLVKQVTRQFIMGDAALGLPGRPNDLIGLIFFARAARVMTPLTLDRNTLLKELNAFNTVGERDQDGTSIGYAIYKAASLIAATRHYAEALAEKKEPAYTIKSEVIILLTDGLQDPNPLDKGKRLRNMDVPEAALYAKSQGIHLYIVNVEPQLNDEQFAPYRHIMQKAAASSGGRFYMVDEKGNLDKIYHDIDQLEKGLIREPLSRNKDQRPDLYRKISFYPYLTALAAACLLCYIFFETYFFRRVP